jgi:hypothetical protein
MAGPCPACSLTQTKASSHHCSLSPSSSPSPTTKQVFSQVNAGSSVVNSSRARIARSGRGLSSSML